MMHTAKKQPPTDEERTEELRREKIAIMRGLWRVREGSPTEVETDEPRPRIILSTGVRASSDERVKYLNGWIARYVVELHNKEVRA